jgi:RNA polymerase sigma factor (sigma-70 family)
MAVPLPHLLKVATRAPLTDAELLDAFARRRDEGAFAELVRRYGPVVYRVCRRVVGRSVADDAFQAAFLVLATRHRAARRAFSIAGWLVGVAGRVARQIRRAEYRRAVRETAVAWQPDAGVEPGTDVGDQLRVLDEELARLPDRLRTPVVLCHLQGWSQEEAAGALGQSARSVRRHLDEARRLLRVRLERRGVVPALAAGLALNAGRAGAVPDGLQGKAVSVVFDYLTGGRGAGLTAPPVALANGVATNMLARKVAVLVVAAVGLTGLGVSFAGGQAPANNHLFRVAGDVAAPPPAVPWSRADRIGPPRALPLPNHRAVVRTGRRPVGLPWMSGRVARARHTHSVSDRRM